MIDCESDDFIDWGIRQMKNKRGRPQKPPNEVKQPRSVRVSENNLKRIIKDFGSLQVFLDACIVQEYLK